MSSLGCGLFSFPLWARITCVYLHPQIVIESWKKNLLALGVEILVSGYVHIYVPLLILSY